MKTTILAILLFVIFQSFGQNGNFDTTFNQTIINELLDGSGPSSGSIPRVNCIKIQADGKILVGGEFFAFNRSNTGPIVRLFPNGAVDTSFHFGSGNSGISSLLIQPDGKIIIGGYFTYYFGNPHKYLLRLNSNGEIDPTFDIGTGINDGGTGYVTDLALDSDGKILVAGNFNTFNGVSKPGVVRLNGDGSIDNTFDIGTGSNTGLVTSIEKMPDGSYFLGGSFTAFNGSNINSLVRVSSTGVIDGSFLSQFPQSSFIYDIDLDSNGDIYVGGTFYQYNGVAVGNIVLLHTDGTQNTFFSPASLAYTVYNLEVTPQNRVVVVGGFSISNGDVANHIVCFESDGSLSTAVNFGQGVNTDAVAVTIKDDGKIIVGGEFEQVQSAYRPCIIQFESSGTVDPTFLPVPGADAQINKIISLPDNKSIVAGSFKHYNGYPCNGLVRLNEDGTIDNTFQFILADALVVDDIIRLPNGGYALIYASIANQTDEVIKIDDQGNIDPNFVSNVQDYNDFEKLLVQADGKLLVSGWLTVGMGEYNGGVIRLDENGIQEPNFFMTLSSNCNIYGMDILPNGKIILGGYNSANGTQWGSVLARILPNGTDDQNFPYIFQYNGSLTDLKVLPDGKIMVMGDFIAYNGFTTRCLVRLNYDGTVDQTFSVPNDPSLSGMRSFKMLANGKILLFGGTDLVLRLNADGTLDTDFPVYTQSWGGVSSVDVQTDGKILVAGNFVSDYTWKYRNNLVRLFHDTVGLSSLLVGFNPIQEFLTCGDSAYCTAFGYFGMAPYSYEWLDAPIYDSARYFTDAGIYELQVTDATGASTIVAVNIEGPASQTGFDLDANLITDPFRPGFNSVMILNGTNHGCLPVSGIMKLVYDPQLDLVNVSPTPTSVIGNTLFWDFSDLGYSDSDFVSQTITFNTPISLGFGDSLFFDLTISPNENDLDTLNNHRNYGFKVVNGYDPNFMEVYPKGKCDQHYVQNDETLVYQVHFQNTGNAEAISIAVDNFLDPDLDLSTLRIVGKSADCWTEIINDHIVRFHFDSIMLIDSVTDPIASQGYIQYEISINGLPHNKLLHNYAEIHFDYNPEAPTNEVFNTVFVGDLNAHDCDLEVGSNTQSDYNVFPNPFVSEIEIRSSESKPVAYLLLDLSGNIIEQGTLADSNKKIDLSKLESGLYLLQLVNEGEILLAAKKIIKL